jgi:hypothetical protein
VQIWACPGRVRIFCQAWAELRAYQSGGQAPAGYPGHCGAVLALDPRLHQGCHLPHSQQAQERRDNDQKRYVERAGWRGPSETDPLGRIAEPEIDAAKLQSEHRLSLVSSAGTSTDKLLILPICCLRIQRTRTCASGPRCIWSGWRCVALRPCSRRPSWRWPDMSGGRSGVPTTDLYIGRKDVPSDFAPQRDSEVVS